MFFKKICTLCLVLLIFSPFASKADLSLLKENACIRDMRAFLPLLKTGRLDWERQKIFFRCLHDSIELFTKYFGHDPDKDHFSRQSIFVFFYHYIDLDESEAWKLTNSIFAIKKALIGGSPDELKDREIALFQRMVYNFRDAYYYLHEVIPIFKKAFQPGAGVITSEEMRKVLQQVERSFDVLRPAYEGEKVSYRLDDLGEYGAYIQALFKGGEGAEESWSGFGFLEDLLTGILHPQKEIQPGQWDVAFKALHQSIHLFLYYKTYFGENTPEPILSYRKMEMADLLFSSLQLSSEIGSGFNMNNLDRMLEVIMGFFSGKENGREKGINSNPSFIQAASKEAIALFTRTVDCFALKNLKSDNCLRDSGDNVYAEDGDTIKIAFKDMRFNISANSIESEITGQSEAILSTAKILVLRQWLDRFKESFLAIYQQGDVRDVAGSRGFSHWLKTFFGWKPEQERISFGSFYSSEDPGKAYFILNYQAFLELFFFSEKGLFQSENVFISEASFKAKMKRMAPALFALGGEQGLTIDSLNKALNALFFIGDSFIHSSNKDGKLSGKELLDTAIHLVEAVKSARFAHNKISTPSSRGGGSPCLSPACYVEEIFKDPGVKDPGERGLLDAYPRLAIDAFLSQTGVPHSTEEYKKQIEKILTNLSDGEGHPVKISDLTEVFLLFQLIEVNFDRINKDASFNLSSEELLPFVQQFFLPIAEKLIDEQLRQSGLLINPLGQEGVLAWLMYSFKMGKIKIPLFPVNLEGIEKMDSKENLLYIRELLGPSSFEISPNDFRFFIFEVYQLYSILAEAR